MSFSAGPPHSLFDGLRPRDDQTLSRCAAATYSLDLVALLGLVLVLGGDGGAEFNTGPLGLSDAFRKVRGRLVVLHQASRLNAPGAHRTVLPLLDTMVRAIPADETRGSWHPKIILARYDGRSGAEWRLWIGSRNLTGTQDLDAGVLLVSGAGGNGKRIAAVGDLAAEMLAEAGWSAAELDELRTARWASPAGTAVHRLVWRRPGQVKDFLADQPIRKPDKVWAVSPFIDRRGLTAVTAALDAPVALLTTRRAASDCTPFAGVAFRVWTAPDPHAAVELRAQQEAPEAEFADPPPSGVHAKLLMTAKGRARALLIGSANLTTRGLKGPNGEAGVWLNLAEGDLPQSLEGFVTSGMDLIPDEPDPALQAREEQARALDAVISKFVLQKLTLASRDDGLFLSLDGPLAVLSEAGFSAAPFHNPELLRPWPAGRSQIRILPAAPERPQQTALVIIQARSHADPAVQRTWTQRVELAGLDTESRDDALLAAYIGAGRFRAWLRSRLDGIEAEAGERWNGAADRSLWTGAVQGAGLFNLEAMLSKWAADPAAFEARLSDILKMLDAFRAAFAALPESEDKAQAVHDLEEAEPFIRAVAQAAGVVSE